MYVIKRNKNRCSSSVYFNFLHNFPSPSLLCMSYFATFP